MTGINWRDAVSDPPTKSDAGDSEVVIIPSKVDEYGFEYRHYEDCDKGLWVSMAEFKAHIESTLNPPDSPWVFVPLPGESVEEAAKHGRCWPTESDGQYILWMADSWSQPGVHPFVTFSQSSHCYRHNLRWCRIPPCPPPPKRELPAKAVNKEECPCKVTLRNGDHSQAVYRRDEGEDKLWLVKRNGDPYLHWWSMEGKQLSFDGGARSMDIVHVGGWLTAEELEALKNGN